MAAAVAPAAGAPAPDPSQPAQQQQQQQSLNLVAYVRDALGPSARRAAYASPWTCQALLRALPALAQQHVLRLLYVDAPVPEDFVHQWMKPDQISRQASTLALLRGLSLIARVELSSAMGAGAGAKAGGGGRAGAHGYVLDESFKRNLRDAFAGCTDRGVLGRVPDPAVLRASPTPRDAAAYAHRQREALLNYLLDPRRRRPPEPPAVLRRACPPLDVHGLLVSAGLLTGGGGAAGGRGGGCGGRGGGGASGGPEAGALTAAGLRFLLLDAPAQLWALVIEYIRSSARQQQQEQQQQDGGIGGRASSASSAATADETSPAALSFLLQLGFMSVGRPYPFDALTPNERRIASHMAQLGLLCAFAEPGQRDAALAAAARAAEPPDPFAGLHFSPTTLAASLCGGSGGAGGGGEEEDEEEGEGGAAAAAGTAAAGTAAAAGAANGAPSAVDQGGGVIVETNYRVYAYTSSPTMVRVLAQIARPDCVLPNLFVGTLTRHSVMRALSRGLDSAGIVAFLRAYAHPRVAARSPVVPEVVTDQIALWEAELRRVTSSPGFLYADFETQELHDLSLEFARSRGYVTWAPAGGGAGAEGGGGGGGAGGGGGEEGAGGGGGGGGKGLRMYAVTMEGHPVVREFIKSLKAQQQQQQ